MTALAIAAWVLDETPLAVRKIVERSARLRSLVHRSRALLAEPAFLAALADPGAIACLSPQQQQIVRLAARGPLPADG